MEPPPPPLPGAGFARPPRGAGDRATPLFDEYWKLALASGWGKLLVDDSVNLEINPKDALIVVDMQNDFIPPDDLNKDGGRFAVAEGAKTVPSIVKMMEKFAEKGAVIVATRDYHPRPHCSFLPTGGPFPGHCLQGSTGSEFYEPIGKKLHELRKAGHRVEIVFKGFHRDVDSFGGFHYLDREPTWDRVSHASPSWDTHGCPLCSWTGAVSVQCSSLDGNINAPPDMMSIFKRTRASDMLKGLGVERLFVCGLALDFCVLDTALNGVTSGFKNVHMIPDAARAARVPGAGRFGSGYLTSPAWLYEKMSTGGVRLAFAKTFVEDVGLEGQVEMLAAKPPNVGAVASALVAYSGLRPAGPLEVEVDLSQRTYKATGHKETMEILAANGVQPAGRISAPGPVRLSALQRSQLGVPEAATQCVWAHPVERGGFSELGWSYFGSEPDAAFFVFGGLVYMDASGRVVAAAAFGVPLGEHGGGGGLSWEQERPWPGPAYSRALEGRWHPVALPGLQELGAKLCAKLAPGEEVAPGGGAAPMVFHHGAFAFLFHDELDASDERDICVPVGSAVPGMESMSTEACESPFGPSPRDYIEGDTGPAAPRCGAPEGCSVM